MCADELVYEVTLCKQEAFRNVLENRALLRDILQREREGEMFEVATFSKHREFGVCVAKLAEFDAMDKRNPADR